MGKVSRLVTLRADEAANMRKLLGQLLIFVFHHE